MYLAPEGRGAIWELIKKEQGCEKMTSRFFTVLFL